MQRKLMGLFMALSLTMGGAGVITGTTALTSATEAQAFGLSDIGGAIKKGAKAVGGAAKNGVKAVGRGIEKGGGALDNATRKAAKKVGRGVEKAGKTIGRGAKDIVRCWPMRCKVTERKPKYPDYQNGYKPGGKAASRTIGTKKRSLQQLRKGAPVRKVQGITRQNLKPSSQSKRFTTRNLRSNPGKNGQRFQTMVKRKRDAGSKKERRSSRMDRRSKSKVQKKSRKNRRGRRG